MSDDKQDSPPSLPGQLSEAVLEDANSLLMQNAVSNQQAMQMTANAAVTTTLALIIKKGAGG